MIETASGLNIKTSTLDSLASKIPLLSLFFFNLLPLAGVIYLHWSVLSIMILYWTETLIIGFFAILRMALANQSVPITPAYLAAHPDYQATPVKGIVLKIFLIPFFCFHFGIFMTVHLSFILFYIAPAHFDAMLVFGGLILSLFSNIFNPENLGQLITPFFPTGTALLPIALSFFSLFAYHLILFIFKFVLPKAYLTTNPASEMGTPYPRVIFTHLILITVSALSITQAKTLPPILIAGIIVGIKTLLDFYLYQRGQTQNRPSLII